jgi:hypothetical protein
MKVKRIFVITLITTIASATFLFAAMAAGNNHFDVTPATASLYGWQFENDNGTGGGGGFVDGPANPPLGSGSARLFLTANPNDGWILYNDRYKGTRFTDITRLEYGTYQALRQGTAVAISLQFTVDNDLTDADNTFKGRLVFEPYQTGATVSDNQWQRWTPLSGKWWGSGSNPITRPFAAACPQSNPCTWQQVLAAFPNGGIHMLDPHSVIFKAGSGWGAFDGNVDAFIIGRKNNQRRNDEQHGNDDGKRGRDDGQRGNNGQRGENGNNGQRGENIDIHDFNLHRGRNNNNNDQ